MSGNDSSMGGMGGDATGMGVEATGMGGDATGMGGDRTADNCKFANDGARDEPFDCDEGTDTTDCSGSSTESAIPSAGMTALSNAIITGYC